MVAAVTEPAPAPWPIRALVYVTAEVPTIGMMLFAVVVLHLPGWQAAVLSIGFAFAYGWRAGVYRADRAAREDVTTPGSE